MIKVLSPTLGAMKWPVYIYALVITIMFNMALHMIFSKNKVAGRWMAIGATLFVTSDSILAINKFYHPFATAGVLIMLTYGLAQYFIVNGAIKYLRGV
jgi:uncharacterized membrane protein YhhN